MLVLVDALDEGDPGEQQVQGFKGGVVAGGNKALALILRFLARKLPRNVRFIFTTRPDAACGGIQAILARAFPDAGVSFVRPDYFRQEEASEAATDKAMVLQTVLIECRLEQSITASVRKKWLEASRKHYFL